MEGVTLVFRIRLLATALMAVSLTVLPASVAFAHGGEQELPAIDLVRQAIAYIVNTPDDMDTITDKVDDAAEAEDQAGVVTALVVQAGEALERDDMMGCRSLLQRAIGARADLSGTDVHPILQVPGGATNVELATGEQTGTNVTVDPLPGRGDLAGTDIVVLGIAAAFALAGLVLGWRWRPRDTIRALRRRFAGAPTDKGP
jgi:hypothetical protein